MVPVEGGEPEQRRRRVARYVVTGDRAGIAGEVERRIAPATASRAATPREMPARLTADVRASKAGRKGRTGTGRPTRWGRGLPQGAAAEVREAGSAREVAHLEARLEAATRAYERDRYGEALPVLRDLARSFPSVVAVRELYGLTLYRLGRWREAARELRQVAELSGSVDQLPVIADCERALGDHGAVVDVWNELRRAGAGSNVVAEGRLVVAGSLADRGRWAEAIALLEQGAPRSVRRPLDRHVRQWYALADLYERSGDVPRARELFRRVVEADPELADAPERLAALR